MLELDSLALELDGLRKAVTQFQVESHYLNLQPIH